MQKLLKLRWQLPTFLDVTFCCRISPPDGALVLRGFTVRIVKFALEGRASLYLQPRSRGTFSAAWILLFGVSRCLMARPHSYIEISTQWRQFRRNPFVFPSCCPDLIFERSVNAAVIERAFPPAVSGYLHSNNMQKRPFVRLSPLVHCLSWVSECVCALYRLNYCAVVTKTAALIKKVQTLFFLPWRL